MPVVRTAIVVISLIALVGCGAQDQVTLQLDEAGPATVAEAWDAADVVIVGRVAEEAAGGARFFGCGDPEDPDPSGPCYEDATFLVEVEQVLKGDPGQSVEIQWPAYVTDGPSSDGRTARLEVQDITMADAVGRDMVLFLAQQDGFGLTGVSLAMGAAELRGGRVDGQVAVGLQDQRGRTVAELQRAASVG